MKNFWRRSSGDNAARYDFTRRSLDELVRLTDLPEGPPFFRPDVSEKIQSILFPVQPNEDGVIELDPKDIDSNRVPVVALRAGETATVPWGSQTWGRTLSQRRLAAEKLQSWGGAAVFGDTTSYVEEGIDTEEGGNQVAVTEKLYAYLYVPGLGMQLPEVPSLGKSTKRSFLLRPLVVLTMDDKKAVESPFILVHEWKHVLQTLLNPVLPEISSKSRKEVTYRQELEAYQFSLNYVIEAIKRGYKPLESDAMSRAFMTPDSPEFQKMEALNLLRNYTNKKRQDKYFPNGTLVKMLEEIGVDLIGR